MCYTGIRALPRVTETIVAFDAAARVLTYQATAGMPTFVTGARNTWTVTGLTTTQCRVDIMAELATRGILGRIARTHPGPSLQGREAIARRPQAIRRDRDTLASQAVPTTPLKYNCPSLP